MKRLTAKLFLISAVLVTPFYQANEQPYSGLTDRSIKALSSSETKGLLAGEGMGLALAAELNAYPGPKHVLELAEQLNLSEQQHQKTERIYFAMQSEARQIGKNIIEQERVLDQYFKNRQIDQQRLELLINKISALKSRLRFVHLNAHLSLYTVLTEHQHRQYQQLRGYSTSKHQHKHLH